VSKIGGRLLRFARNDAYWIAGGTPAAQKAVIARSAATRQSPSELDPAKDCFASLAMTGMVQGMKSCILDGSELADAAAVYRRLGEALHVPSYFGSNPDALWDAITEYDGEPIAIVWRNSARSAARLGPGFDDIVEVLRRAAAENRIAFRPA
jgi:ribonuclease inhibitor